MNVVHHLLRNLDLNLLPVFDAIYRHRSVVSAANELAISPSALSHALARLRVSFSDDLFLRQGSRMQPTSRAEEVAAVISSALGQLTSGLSGHEVFAPASSSRQFTFAATDYTAAVLFPSLIARLQQSAPAMRVRILYSKQYDAVDDLLTGKADFAVGFEEEDMLPRQGLEALELFRDDYVVAVRQENPLVGNTLEAQHYLALGHVVVKPWNEPQRTIDSYLQQQGVSRKIVAELPSVMSAPFIVYSTDLAITLPRRGVEKLFDTTKMKIFPPPFSIPGYTLKLYFSPSRVNTASHSWMKEQILLSAGAS
jgi:DNA-binding transcriptional LysR family regulator